MKSILFLSVFLSSALYNAWSSYIQVCIATTSGANSYTVEVVDDLFSRAIGLMYRNFLPPKTGMLFIYPDEIKVSFWMKNVTFAADIIFIADSDKVVQIEENAQPNDMRPITPSALISSVLEFSTGTVLNGNIKVGNLVSYIELTSLKCDH